MVLVRFLRDSLVVARVWSGFKARGLNIIIVAIRNEDQSLVVRDTKWQLNIPNHRISPYYFFEMLIQAVMLYLRWLLFWDVYVEQ